MIQIRFTLDPEKFLHSSGTNVNDVIDIADLFQISKRNEKEMIGWHRRVDLTVEVIVVLV